MNSKSVRRPGSATPSDGGPGPTPLCARATSQAAQRPNLTGRIGTGIRPRGPSAKTVGPGRPAVQPGRGLAAHRYEPCRRLVCAFDRANTRCGLKENHRAAQMCLPWMPKSALRVLSRWVDDLAVASVASLRDTVHDMAHGAAQFRKKCSGLVE